MKTAIIYYSKHHGNTRKLLEPIASLHDVDLIDVTAGRRAAKADLKQYDRIGIASGVYAGSLSRHLIKYLKRKLPKGRDVFYIYTSAGTGAKALSKARRIARSRKCREIGTYYSRGYNTFGPFKLVGGTSKGHPTAEEIRGALEFYENL